MLPQPCVVHSSITIANMKVKRWSSVNVFVPSILTYVAQFTIVLGTFYRPFLKELIR